MLLSKKTILTAIVCSVALTLNACGKKKTGTSSENRATQVTVESVPVPTTENVTGPTVPGPVGGGLEIPKPNTASSELDTQKKNTPAQIEANEMKYDPLDPRNVEKNDVTKRLTGARSEDGLVYTGNSTDYLLTFLRTRMENVKSDAVKRNNLTLAKLVKSAQLRIGEAGDVIASIRLQDGNEGMTLHLGGAVSSDAFSPLKMSQHDQKQVNMPKADGEFRCLDLNGTCETSMLRLSLNVKGTSGVVNIVFRNSLADLHVRFPSKPSESTEYMNLENFVRNAEYNRDTNFKIKEIRMESFEVVNGRSGFKTVIMGANDEVMAFGGPLLAPEFGTALSLTADRTVELEQSLDLEKIGATVSRISDTIASAKIVNNNGLGQVRLSLTLRKRAGFDPDTVFFTMMRVSKPIIYLSEENVYLK